MAAKITSLDEYCDMLGDVRASTVRRIIETIQLDYPRATVKIAWNVPQVQIDGEYVFGINSAKGWLVLASWNPASLPSFAERLKAYEMNERTFRVPVDWEPDRELLRDLVADRLAQLNISK
jgi:uncharacterized protein YdhG (YjbR/CyaY superfamily)